MPDAYSYEGDTYAMEYVRFAGADAPRSVKLRKMSTGEWFMTEIPCLPDIRIPKSEAPWT